RRLRNCSSSFADRDSASCRRRALSRSASRNRCWVYHQPAIASPISSNSSKGPHTRPLRLTEPDGGGAGGTIGGSARGGSGTRGGGEENGGRAGSGADAVDEEADDAAAGAADADVVGVPDAEVAGVADAELAGVGDFPDGEGVAAPDEADGAGVTEDPDEPVDDGGVAADPDDAVAPADAVDALLP